MWRLVADGANPSSAGVLFMVGSFCQVSEGMDAARTKLQEVKGLFIHKKLNKLTKTTP